MRYFLFLEDEQSKKKELVGAKSSFLSTLIHSFHQKNITVPLGFTTTIHAFRDFIEENQLDQIIATYIEKIEKTENQTKKELYEKEIEKAFFFASFNDDFITELTIHYDMFLSKYPETTAFAVRSSSTYEDLSNASFAGQQETFLNIFSMKHIIHAIKKVFGSFYSNSVISYKKTNHIAFNEGSMCVCIQTMINARSSGVMFTAEPQTGFKQVISISANYGLGESIVQGIINPDEYLVYKNHLAIIQKTIGNKKIKTTKKNTMCPGKSTKTSRLNKTEQNQFALSDKQIIDIARLGITIEKEYGYPVDIEWVEEIETTKIFILQVRPITTIHETDKQIQIVHKVAIKEGETPLITGKAIGTQSASGKVKLCKTIEEAATIQKNEILVTRMTDPSWEPFMKKAAGIVTDMGGRTCHAAIIARELGIPAIVGCSHATKTLEKNVPVTVCCSQGEIGMVLAGERPIIIEKKQLKAKTEKTIGTRCMINVGNPGSAFMLQHIPHDGIGLARMEFIIASIIKIHPQAALTPEKLPLGIQHEIKELIIGYDNPRTYFVEKLTEGISMIAASIYPKQMILRLSDFKTNEYEKLIGGTIFEAKEENPMLGFRGAARYLNSDFQSCFSLECEAIKKAREILGFNNIDLMIPFVRTIDECKAVIALLEKEGLKRSKNLKIIMMCEIPANALLAEEFLQHVDGFSIGSNDMTQLALGVDRDGNKSLHDLFDEQNEAVKILISMAIKASKKMNKYIGICGQAPSDHPEFARWLIKEGIESISLNPDSVDNIYQYMSHT
jgi:pyruvate,water dikinase